MSNQIFIEKIFRTGRFDCAHVSSPSRLLSRSKLRFRFAQHFNIFTVEITLKAKLL